MDKEKMFFSRHEQARGISLNKVQQEAVVHHEGPLLLLATPGSGKTTTIIMRIGYLIEQCNVTPNKIIAVTFSREAATDMRKRYKTLFPHLQPIHFSTIHSLAFSIVRDVCAAKGISFKIIEGSNNKELHQNNILRNIYEHINHALLTTDHLEELKSYISYIKNKMIPKEKWHKVKCDVKNALAIFKEYEQFKERGTDQLLIDYDDMLCLANEALETNERLLAKYEQQFQHVLTDESQDTSLVQHAIIEKLVAKHKNITVVADDDQSIYTWRAADPQYLLNFKKVYPNATMKTMEQNYRSSKNIVTTANEFIKQNEYRYEKDMFTNNASDRPIQFTCLTDYSKQKGYLVDVIKKKQSEKEIAILYRNNLSAIILIDAFDKAGIPFYMKDVHNRFFEHWIVADILNFMRLAYDDTRVSTLEKIFSKFNGYISNVQLQKLQQTKSKSSVFDRLSNMSGVPDYQIKNLKNIKKQFQQMNTMAPNQMLQLIRHELGYEDILKRISDKFGFNYADLLEILYILEEIAADTKTMVTFAQRINYLKQLMRNASENIGTNAVTLSTLHRAKGLEFDEVYMIDLVEGNLPANNDIEEEEKGNNAWMEEAVRLFYVGMTRAKSYLELITYKNKLNEAVSISRFYDRVKQIVHPEKKKETTDENEGFITRNSPSIRLVSELTIGLSIKHRVFGRGKVMRLEDDIVEIRFTKEIKKLSIATCLERHLLEVV